MSQSLSNRLLAEFLGTGLLVMAVVGSGAMAEQLTTEIAVQLLANSLATVGALVTLIWMFGSLSGAHFNPLVTIFLSIHSSFPWRQILPYLVAQTSGGIGGAVLANLMFDLSILGPSSKVRTGGGVWLGELIATFTLLLVIHLIGKSNPAKLPIAVGIWIGGAYWFTSSTSLANPSVTVARMFTTSFAGIAPQSVAAFVIAQIAGLIVLAPVIRLFDQRK